MSRNGTGTYSAPGSTWNPPVNGVTATAADWATLLADLASALTQSVSKDGQTPVTGNLAMGGNKLTGLADGSAATDSTSYQQIAGVFTSVASASTVNLGATSTPNVDITGTTTITAITMTEGQRRLARFAGAVTLTHGASLVLPGAANITTAAGDYAIFVGRAAGVVECINYQVKLYSPAPAFSITANGYFKMANGLVIQWGGGSTTASGVTVTYPIAFPNNVLSIVLSPFNSTAGLTTYQAPTSTTFFAQGWDTAGTQTNNAFTWIAIGY